MLQRPGQPRIISITCLVVPLRQVATTRPATHHQHHLLRGVSGKGCKDQASHASLASFAPRLLWDDQNHALSASFAPWFLRERLHASSASFAPRFFRAGLQTPDQPRISSIICSKVFWGALENTRPATHHEHHLLRIICFKVCVVSG